MYTLIVFIQILHLCRAQILDLDPIDLLIPTDTDSIRCRSEFLCQQCDRSQIRCENLNLTSLSPIRDAWPQTELIRFSGNSIKVLNTTIFSSQAMSSLKVLDLSNNQIEFLDSSAFENLPVLEELILDANLFGLEEETNATWFEPIASSLTNLSLINSFKTVKPVQLKDVKIHSLLKSTPNIKRLKLSDNDLFTFNVDNTVDFDNLTKSDRNYEDILCLLPDLEDLYLDRNRLETIRFEVSCINQNENFNLTSLHLEANSLANIDAELIKIFKRMKSKNEQFRVFLRGNSFRCDCSMYELYKFLRSNESDGIVSDKSNLTCGHNGSIIYVFGKRLIDAQLDRLCGYQNTTNASSGGKFTYVFTTRPRMTTTANATRTASKEPIHSRNKLILFMFASLLISGLIVFILKVHCFKMFRFSQLSWYKSLLHQSSQSNAPTLPSHVSDATGGETFNASTVNGANTPEYVFDQDQRRIVLNPMDPSGVEIAKKATLVERLSSRLPRFMRSSSDRYRTTVMLTSQQPMLTMGVSQSSLIYDQLAEEEQQQQQQPLSSKSVVSKLKTKKKAAAANLDEVVQTSKLKLKNVMASSDEESDKEKILGDENHGEGDKVYLDLSPKLIAHMRP